MQCVAVLPAGIWRTFGGTTVSASLRAVPSAQVGLASGIGSTFQNVGGVIGVATATAIFASTGRNPPLASFTAGLRPALAALAGFAAAGLLAGLATGPRPPGSAGGQPQPQQPVAKKTPR